MQALMSLGEVYPAVCAAEKAVGLNTNWWIGHQTLGRAQLGLGEVNLVSSMYNTFLVAFLLFRCLQISTLMAFCFS